MGANWTIAGAGATRPYSYTAGAATGGQSVTATNNATLTSTAGTWSTQADSTAPSGGAFTANGIAANRVGTSSYLTSAGATLLINSRSDYTDAGSGLASSTLTIKSATLTNNTCGSYGAPTTISGTTTQTVASGNCYLLTLTGTDNVGNATNITTSRSSSTPPPPPRRPSASAASRRATLRQRLGHPLLQAVGERHLHRQRRLH